VQAPHLISKNPEARPAISYEIPRSSCAVARPGARTVVLFNYSDFGKGEIPVFYQVVLKMSDEKKDLKLSSDDLKKQILGSMAKPYKGEQTSRWIRNMDDESLVDEITKATPSARLNLTSPALLDRMFDEFQRYAYEYQNAAASGARIAINVGRPTGGDGSGSGPYGKVPVLAKGHISTNNWAMIFFGLVGKIQAFIVPVEYTVGFQPSQNEFKPFVELKSVPVKGGNDWQVDGYSISSELLPPLAKRFFGAIIKVQRQEAKHTDQFVMDPTVPVEAPAPPQRLEERQGIELLSDSVLEQEAARKKQFQLAGQQPPYQSFGQPPAPSHQSVSQPSPSHPAAGHQPLPNPALDQQSLSNQAVNQQSLSHQAVSQQRYQPPTNAPQLSGDGASDTIAEAFHRNNVNIQAAIADFFSRMDIEVDRLTKIGMMSIQSQDMVGAQQTIIRSAKLKEMRERVNDLSNEWNAVVKE
jgi:hypothetical protein